MVYFTTLFAFILHDAYSRVLAKGEEKRSKVTVHAMKACRGSTCKAPLILNLGTRWRWVVNLKLRLLYPREITLIPVVYEAGWAPELDYTFWWKEKSVVPARIWSPDRAACSLVAIVYSVLLLHHPALAFRITMDKYRV